MPAEFQQPEPPLRELSLPKRLPPETASRFHSEWKRPPLRGAVLAAGLMLVPLLATGTQAGEQEPRARIYVEVHRTSADLGFVESPLHRSAATSGLVGSWLGGTHRHPAFATLEAGMAHWDAEAGWDGWLATVRVFDAAGQPVRISGNAIFELTPRVVAADLNSFLLVPDKRLRWTTLIVTDEYGCATVKLPLRRNLPGTTGGDAPLSGVLRVRVAVASEGVYEADAVVAIRSMTPLDTISRGGLVDTLWNGR